MTVTEELGEVVRQLPEPFAQQVLDSVRCRDRARIAMVLSDANAAGRVRRRDNSDEKLRAIFDRRMRLVLPLRTPRPTHRATARHAMTYLDLLHDLIARARAAGADAADAVLIAGTSLSVQSRLGKTEHIERSEGRDLGLRVFVGQKAAIVSSTAIDPAGFPGWPSAPSRWRASSPTIPTAGWPIPLRRRSRWRSIWTTRPSRTRRRWPPAPPRPRTRRWPSTASPTRKAPAPASAGPRRAWSPRRDLPAGRCAPVTRSPPPRSPVRAPGCSATTTTIPPSTSQTWTTRRKSAAAPANARSPGSTRPGRRPRNCRSSMIRGWREACSGTSPAPSTGRASPAAPRS